MHPLNRKRSQNQGNAVDPASITIESLVQFAGSVGGNAILLLVLFALIRGWLVPKPWMDDIRKDRDGWREIARGGVQQAAESTRAQTRTVGVAEEAARAMAALIQAQQAQSQAQSPPNAK